MANNNHSFTNEIKDYEIIRNFIRQLFLFGDSTTKELIESRKYGSTTNVYSHLKRIENYLKDDRLTSAPITAGGKRIKNTRIVYDPLTYPINNLTRTFQECKFNVSDISFFFTLLQMFADEDTESNGVFDDELLKNTETPFTLPDLIDDFYEVLREKREFLFKKGQLKCTKKDLEKQPFSEETFRRFFNVLRSDFGIFIDTSPEHDREKITENSDTGTNDASTETDSKSSDRSYRLYPKNENNEYFYKLCNDIFSDLPGKSAALTGLLDMICFFYNSSDIAVPGWQLANTLYTYMFHNALTDDIEYTEEPIFQFSDANALSVIDNDIFWSLITEIYRKNAVTFEYSADQNNKPMVFPIRIVCEKQYGRQYLFAYNYWDDQYRLFRLDRISNIEVLRLDDDEKYIFADNFTAAGTEAGDLAGTLDAIYEQVFRHAWNVDITGYQNPQEVLIHFHTSEDKLASLIGTVSEQKKHGTIENRTDTGFDFRIAVPNTVEIIPWIRSFGADAAVDKNTNPELYDTIKSTLSEMLTRYESI